MKTIEEEKRNLKENVEAESIAIEEDKMNERTGHQNTLRNIGDMFSWKTWG